MIDRNILETAKLSTPGFMVKLGAKSLVWAALVVLLGLGLTTYQSLRVKAQLRESALARFQLQSERIESDMQSQLEKVAGVLRGVRATLASSDFVSRSDFRNWVNSRQIEQEFPGVRGVGLVERVMREQLPAFVDTSRRDGAPDFTVRSVGNAPDLFVVKFLEPQAPNQAALGYDVGSEIVRRVAAERAVREGQPVLSGRVSLVQDKTQRAGFLYFLPVYRETTQPESQDERTRTVLGWAYAPIVAAAFLEHTQASTQDMTDFQLFDGLNVDEASLVFDSDFPMGHRDGGNLNQHVNALFSQVIPIQLGGQIFQLRTFSSAKFESTTDLHSWQPVACLGVILSFLLGWVVWLLLAGRERAERLAGSMTQDLERLALVARHTSNAVIFSDNQRGITWVNEGFTRMTGYTAQEALGQQAGELLRSDNADPAARMAIQNAVQAGKYIRQLFVNRAKDGRDYWVDLEVHSLRSKTGKPMGLLAIENEVTKEVVANEALRREKERTENILSATNVGTWEWNLRTGQSRANPRWSAMMGFTPDEVHDDPRALWLRQIHPDDLATSRLQMTQYLRGRSERYACATRVRCKDGSLIWIQSHGKAISYTSDGKIEWIAGIHMDITESKLAEQKLLDAEMFLDRVGKVAGIGAWQINLDNGEIFWNDQTCEIHGVEPGFRPTLDQAMSFYPESARTELRAAMDRAVEAGSHWDMTTEFVNAQGLARWVRSVGEVEHDDRGAVRLLGALQDVTRDKQAELELQASTLRAESVSAMLQSVLDSAVDVGVIATDLEQVVTVFNKGAERLLGYSAVEVVGQVKSGRFLAPHPESADVFGEKLSSSQQSECVFVRKDGSAVTVSLAIAPMRDAKGAIFGYLGVAQDISRQKEYEQSLHAAKTAAEQSSVAKSQFLANMSHEIRTPMNAILGMLALLQHTPLSDRQRDYAEKTEGAARSLLGLLNDILDFSKVEAGKLQIDPEPFQVERLLSDLSVILSANLGQKNLDILFDVDPDIPGTLVGDALRIKQILINLGGNAVKFTSQGQVVVQMRLLKLQGDKARIAIAVRDSGIGIAPENQTRIFEGFSQAEANTTRRYGGTGLGLVISQRLIQLMGSELELTSALGEGSTFRFELDLPVGSPQGNLPQTPKAHVHVLLVDDNPVALETGAATMASLGWRVTQAPSGAHALEQVQRHLSSDLPALQAIFVDWQMPAMDGWETLREVRRLYGTRPTPALIMLSGQGRELLNQRSTREQALLNGFMVKPLTAAMFLSALEQVQDPLRPGADEQTRATRRTPRLEGMRILVVEDNAINQQVAMELLRNEGAQVSLAENGRLGVDLVAAAEPQFDVVLMDLQMPVMDGLTAARAIRMELGMHGLPIIAMTANAMTSDQQDCLDAGMNAHVGKPFDLNHLVAVLLTHTEWKTTEGASNLGDLDQEEMISDVDWPAGMDGNAALQRMAGDIGLMAQTLRAFAADGPAVVDRVEALLEQQQASTAGRELHTLKGLAATLGLTELQELSARAEKWALTLDPRVQAALEDIRKYLDRQVPVLVVLTDRLIPVKRGAVEPDHALLTQLRTLQSALVADDMGAMEIHATLRITAGHGLTDAMTALDAAMAELDFGLAESECERLIHRLGC